MNDTQAERVVRLLEEIRDGQRLQLERQGEALKRQEELVAQQKARLATLSERSGNADDILAASAQVVTSARILVWAVPLAIVCVAVLLWLVLARS
jgi:hypothetical protein